MSVDDATWSEIRRGYSDGRESVVRLAARFGVSVGAIRYRVRRYGWTRSGSRFHRTGRVLPENIGKNARSVQGNRDGDMVSASRQQKRLKRTKNVSGDPLATREEVVGRLYRAILRKLSNLEDRMDNEQPLSAAESERETRELSTMVRSFEKVTGVAAEIAKERKPKARESAGDSADAERMRQEIAERLERLHVQWDAEGRSGKSG